MQVGRCVQLSSAVLHDVHIQVEQLAGLQATETCSLLLGTVSYQQALVTPRVTWVNYTLPDAHLH